MRSFLARFTPNEKKIASAVCIAVLAATGLLGRSSSSSQSPSIANLSCRTNCETSVVQTISESSKVNLPDLGASSVNSSSTVKKISRSTSTLE